MDWTVGDLMRRQVYTVSVGETVADLTRGLVRNRCTGAPVVDSAGRVVGVVSLVDVAIAKAVQEDSELARRPVSDIMTPSVVQVRPDTPVAEAVELFRRHRIQRLVVVHEERLVGVISPLDLLDVALVQTRPRFSLEEAARADHDPNPNPGT